MKINAINIDKFQGLHHVALEVNEPVLLVSGGNGAGKSSLLDAIAMAINGEARRVNLKKDYKELVNDTAKKGSVKVLTGDGELSIDLPSGKGAHMPVNQYMQFVLDASRFASLDAKDRRKVLFKLTGASAKPEVIASKLSSRGVPDEYVNRVKPFLLSGFAVAAERAKELASEARGAWRATTGEVYGSKKAEDWKPELPSETANPEQLEKATAEINKISDGITKFRDELSKMDAWADRYTNAEATHKLLQSKLGDIEALEQSLDLAKKEEANKLEELRQLKEKAEGKKGLVHELALFVETAIGVFKIESKEDEELVLEAEQLIAKYVEEHGPVMAEADPSLSAQIPKLYKECEAAGKEVAAIQVALGDAKVAQETLKNIEIPPENWRDNYEAKKAEVQEKLAENERKVSEAKSKIEVLEESIKEVEEAKEKAEKARFYHEEAKGWAMVNEALSPEGIPAEILSEALSPVNDLLRELSQEAGWKDARINGDIDITYGERLYGLLSESEKWRTDTLLAIAIARLSGINFVTIDRFDVLEPQARPQALKLLLKQTGEGHLTQAFMAGTMKQPMPSTPPGMQQVWIDEGTIQQ